jgi:guanylate kinase
MTELVGAVPVVVLAAPSGTGKTTIARTLVLGSERYVFSVSATTRPPRSGERQGVDYDFVSSEQFERMRNRGELAEWASVHGNLYGTPLANVRGAVERGVTVVLDIDVQGARQVKESIPEAVLVFILPPSAEELVRRLSGRGTEQPGEMERRLRVAAGEFEAVDDFDYVVVNRDLTEAIEEIERIVDIEGRRPSRVRDLGAFVSGLTRGIGEHLDALKHEAS